MTVFVPESIHILGTDGGGRSVVLCSMYVDTLADLPAPTAYPGYRLSMGCTARVINDNSRHRINSVGQWVDITENNCEYTLPPATSNSLGGIMVGSGLTIDSAGMLSGDFSALWDSIYQTEKHLTGVPPLSFMASGNGIEAAVIYGNGSQTGTPTPENPVMPTFCGVRTGNLWDEDYTGISGSLKYVPVYVGDGSFTLSTDTPDYSGNAPLFLLSGNVTSGASTPVNGVYNGVSRTAVSSNGYITIAFRRQSESYSPITHNTMLNLGSTALPYEPYGWAEKITCAGQTVPVYLGQTQTVRRVKKLVLTGEEAIAAYDPTYSRFSITIQDSLIVSVCLSPAICTHYQVISDGRSIANVPNNAIYSDSVNGRWYIKTTEYTTVDDFKSYLAAQYAAGTPVTVWYVLATPETGIVNEPLAKIGDYADELHSTDAGISIQTVRGQNTLTIGTTLQPSKISITYF